MGEVWATFLCVYCAQANEVPIDADGLAEQSYVEDCQVCCRPNLLHVHVDAEHGEASVWAEQGQ